MTDVGLTTLCCQVRAEFASTKSLEASDRLPEEVEEGNVEYKQQLLAPSPGRLRQLTTQMHWRLNEGKGTAFYELGVKDNGEVLGLKEEAILRSLVTLARMCRVVHAEMSLSQFRGGRDASHKAVRIQIVRVRETHATKRLRMSLIGDFMSGKSTLVGVLTRGCLDDGAGLARMQVCRHRHELENGCTSSVSEHTIAVAADGHFRRIEELRSYDFEDSDDESKNIETFTRQERFITLSDLAGHLKYLKSTASGLAGQFPDYAMVVIDAVRGVRDMTREHMKIATALNVAIFVVITKIDIATNGRIEEVICEITDLVTTFCPNQQIILAPKCTSTIVDDKTDLLELTHSTIVPVFQISSVTGTGLDVLQGYFAKLEPKRLWAIKAKTPAEFQIRQAYDIKDAGIIVTGLVQAGTMCVHEQMLLGPDADGNFCDVLIESLEVQHKAAQTLSAGETGAVRIRFLSTTQPAYRLRKGTMLVHPSVRPIATRQFDAELHFLPDARRFRENNQVVIHTGQVRQMAKIVELKLPHTTKSLPAAPTMCRFEFMYWPEYIQPDVPLVLRDGRTQAVGRVVRTLPFFRKEPRATHVSSC
ncbi:gtp-binding [Plasmopara halstedii]|uniref:Elongation factor Tu, chloroplastic n=1 Tax=Plasmopara halstedii TaxID=4781 RepID=A0A0P1B017_PLAHL|nr:gtp-binding [Plasmopara halstedii]CEG48084.1 gtp-binding [Plasmopara halstedii]|eukprot:XP_024584453.1 gtp-binding [Plasmopara halstedii]